SNSRTTVVFPVILPPNGIGHDAHADGPAAIDQARQQRRRAHALVVITDEHNVALAKLRLDDVPELGDAIVFKRAALLVIHADHLLRMTVLGAADIALLDRAGPIVGRDDAFVIDVHITQQLPNALAVL